MGGPAGGAGVHGAGAGQAADGGPAGQAVRGAAEDATGPGPIRAWNRTRSAVLADRLEMAGSFAARFLGLMGRPPLPRGHGLWLTGAGSIHMLFMRFAIDAVFLGPALPSAVAGAPASGSALSAADLGAPGASPPAAGSQLRLVVGVHAGLRPWVGLAFARGAGGVLELPAGTIAATGTSVGDEVVLEGTAGERRMGRR